MNDLTEVKYQSNGIDISLSIPTIKKYLVSGSSNAVTDQECMAFLQLCRAQRLNPFLREAYLVKYKPGEAANIVVGKDTFQKRASRCPQFDGYESGVIAVTHDGEIKEREGTIILPGEILYGGWCKVYRKDYRFPIYASCAYGEYVQLKGDGTPNRTWSKMPGVMIRKCAIATALRDAFPEEMAQMYCQEEIGTTSDVKLDEKPIDVPSEVRDIPTYKEPDHDFQKAPTEEIEDLADLFK